MRILLVIASFTALGVLLLAPFGVYLGNINLDTCKQVMFAATVVWFCTSPFWMRKPSS